MRFKDYLFYLLNMGENPEGAAITRQQHHLERGGEEHFYEIALIVSSGEATQLLPANPGTSNDLAAWIPSLKHHQFTQLSRDAPLPSQPFDELHWLCTDQTDPAGLERLKKMARLIHIHFVGVPSTGSIFSAERVYHWQRRQDIFDFWSSLYRGRDSLSSCGLNWGSYPSKSSQPMIGYYTSADGTTPSRALLHLKNSMRLTDPPGAQEAVLVIEYSPALSVGEYACIMDFTGRLLGCDIAPVLHLSEEHERCTLRLLSFMPQ